MALLGQENLAEAGEDRERMARGAGGDGPSAYTPFVKRLADLSLSSAAPCF